MGASDISKEDIENMMKIADTDGGGTVDFDEFVVMLRAIKDKADKRAAEKKWISVFSSLDFDKWTRKYYDVHLKILMLMVGEHWTRMKSNP